MQPKEHKNITYQQEALRKATHFIALLIPLSYVIFPREWAIAVMAIAFAIVAIFEVFRLKRMAPWKLVDPVVGSMIRPKEQNGNFTGAFYILLAGTLTIAFFPRWVATTAIAFEILGDVASALVGRKLGHHKIRGQKSIEGAVGFLIVALLIVVVMPKVPYTVGIAGAVVAAIVEAVSIHRDDNLTVPLSSGLVMYLMMQIWPHLP